MPVVPVQTSDFLIEVLHELRAIIGEHRLGGSERGSVGTSYNFPVKA